MSLTFLWFLVVLFSNVPYILVVSSGIANYVPYILVVSSGIANYVPYILVVSSGIVELRPLHFCGF